MKCAGISIVRFIGGFILATVVYLVGFYIAYNVQSILNHFIRFPSPAPIQKPCNFNRYGVFSCIHAGLRASLNAIFLDSIVKF